MSKDQCENILPVKPKLITEIVERIQGVSDCLKLLNKIDMYDYNRMLEDYVLGILNIVYDMNFKNLNYEKKNFPAIDLGDKTKRVCVQVTTDNDRDKITTTLKKFFYHDLDKDYDVIWIFIFGDKNSYRKSFETENGFEFDKEKHIIDIGILIKEIEKKEEQTLYKICDYLKNKHGYFNEQIDLYQTVKLTMPVDKNFIKRKWIPIQYLNSTSEKKEKHYLWPEEAIRINRRVVLVCEAGFGKTEEARNLNNIIGEKFALSFPVYYELSTYNDDRIEELILEKYPGISAKNVALILDGFDELGDREIIFRRQLEAFTKRYPSVYVILTSRKSHFDAEEITEGGTFYGYSIFQIAPFTDNQIQQYVEIFNGDSLQFMLNIARKGYHEHIRNAFFMVHLVNLYIEDKELPNSDVLFDKLIDKSILNDKKHFRSVITRDNYRNLKEYLMALGFISYAIDKKCFTNEHLKAIFNNEEVEILLKHVTIWQKTSNNMWYFIHNNFAEFLAAKFLSILPFEEYKSIIATGNDQNLLIPRWEQVVNFLLTLSHDKELISWIVENNLGLLSKIEVHHLDNATKNRLFIKYFDEYRDKRIFMNYDVVSSIINAGLIFSRLQLEYLMKYINEDVYFTTVKNSIILIESSTKLYGMEKDVKLILCDVVENDHYRNYEKKDALRALTDHKLISCEMLRKFICINEHKEEQYIRSGYFYSIGMLGFSDEMSDYLLKSYDKVSYSSNNDVELIDQKINYEKAIGQFRKITSIEKCIEKIREIADQFESATILVRGLIESLKALHQSSIRVDELVFRLYSILSDEFDSTINEVIALIVDLKMEEGLVKYILSHNSKRVMHNFDAIIDKKAADYIINWYQSDQYEEENAKKIILNLTTKNPYAISIFNVHEEKTGENRIASLVNNEHSKKMIIEAEDRLQKIIFYEHEAEIAIKNFLDKHTGGKPVKICDMIEDKKIHRNEYSEIDRLLSYLVARYFNKEKMLEPGLTNIEDRDTFILCVQYHKHRNKREYRLKGEYFDELKHICFDKVAKYSQKDFISIVDGEYKGVYWDAIYTSYFYYVYDFDYPINFFQKMLVIDWRYYKEPKDFYKVLNRLTVDEAKKYIEKNMIEGHIYGDTLKYHVEFCIENKLYDYCDKMEEYLRIECDEFIGKKAAAEYICVVKGTDYFIKNFYDELEGQLLKDVDKMLIELDEELLAKKIMSQTRTYDDESQRMYHLKILIRCNELSGLTDYMSWIKKNKKSYKENCGYSSINESVKQFRNPLGVSLLVEMCALMLSEEYDDDDFDNLYRNAKAALIDIARKSDEEARNVHDEVTKIITKYNYIEDIGFMNHILDDVIELLRGSTSSALKFSQAINLYQDLFYKRKLKKLDEL